MLCISVLCSGSQGRRFQMWEGALSDTRESWLAVQSREHRRGGAPKIQHRESWLAVQFGGNTAGMGLRTLPKTRSVENISFLKHQFLFKFPCSFSMAFSSYLGFPQCWL